ncbi:MAG: hypothetical protein LBB84_01880 [Tannerellaceae bacterium]|nr:hypothetical protein [Tannerellaceae bacterium]
MNYKFQPSEPARREAADPTVVWFKDRYYLFASMSGGYWRSKDLLEWEFVDTFIEPAKRLPMMCLLQQEEIIRIHVPSLSNGQAVMNIPAIT